jgi:hypothetical protein
VSSVFNVTALSGGSLVLLYSALLLAAVFSLRLVIRLKTDSLDRRAVLVFVTVETVPKTFGAIALNKGRSVGRQSATVPKQPSREDQYTAGKLS